MTRTELKEKIARFERVIAGTTDAEEKRVMNEGLKTLQAKLAGMEETPTPAPATQQKKPAPAKKTSKPHAEKKAKPDCDELAAAYDKRMSAVKTAAGKPTQPILKIIGEKLESAVKSAINFNKGKGGDLNLDEIKVAVRKLADGMDALKEALKGDFEDMYIDKFKEDLGKIIKALEKKQ